MYSISEEYYLLSVETALRFGYKRITKANYPLYRGECFVRYGKIWIHDLTQLMEHVGMTSTNDPRLKKYNLNDYYKFQDEILEREIARCEDEYESFLFDELENEREYLETTHPNFNEMSEYNQEYLRSLYRDKRYKKL